MRQNPAPFLACCRVSAPPHQPLPLQAQRCAARALHTCPWELHQRHLLARTAIDESLSYSLPALRISGLVSLVDLHQATQSYQPLPRDVPSEPALLDAFAVRVMGLTAQPCSSNSPQQGREVCQVRSDIPAVLHLQSLDAVRGVWTLTHCKFCCESVPGLQGIC